LLQIKLRAVKKEDRKYMSVIRNFDNGHMLATIPALVALDIAKEDAIYLAKQFIQICIS